MRTRRPLRGDRGRQLAVTQTVSPGQWIRVPIPGEPFPVHIRIGATQEFPAFIDHDPDGRGGWTAVAALRAPRIPAGVYPVLVRLPDGNTIETAISIV